MLIPHRTAKAIYVNSRGFGYQISSVRIMKFMNSMKIYAFIGSAEHGRFTRTVDSKKKRRWTNIKPIEIWNACIHGMLRADSSLCSFPWHFRISLWHLKCSSTGNYGSGAKATTDSDRKQKKPTMTPKRIENRMTLCIVQWAMCLDAKCGCALNSNSNPSLFSSFAVRQTKWQ